MAYLQKDSNSGVFYIILACFFWGTGGTAFKFFSPEDAQPAVIGIFRLIVTVIILALIVALQKKSAKRNSWSIPILLVTGFLIASMQFCFFTAVDIAGVALGTTFFVGSYPIFAGIFAFLLRKERPVKRWWASTVLAIIGGVLMTLGSVAVDGDPEGILWALATAASFALYATLIKGLLAEHSTISVMAVTSAVGVVFFTPLLFFYDISWVVRDIEIVLPLSVYLGVFTSICPLFLFSQGLKQVHVSTAATLNLVEPLTATLLSVFILHEHLAPQSWFGMALLIVGVLWLSLPSSLLRRVSHV